MRMKLNNKISFRVRDVEMAELVAEGNRRSPPVSPHVIALERMRAWASLAALKEEVAATRHDVRRASRGLRLLLANVCKVLLVRGGKEPEDRAHRWVEEHLLK